MQLFTLQLGSELEYFWSYTELGFLDLKHHSKISNHNTFTYCLHHSFPNGQNINFSSAISEDFLIFKRTFPKRNDHEVPSLS